MGTSPGIDKLKQDQDDFKDFCDKIQADLDGDVAAATTTLHDEMTKWATDNHFDDVLSIGWTRLNHQVLSAEFSLDVIAHRIDDICQQVLAGTGSTPEKGVTLDESALTELKSAEGTAQGAMDGLELLAAVKAVQVISSILEDVHGSTTVSSDKNVKSVPLAAGCQMFVLAASKSYDNNHLTGNEQIQQYVFESHLLYSHENARSQMAIGIDKTLQNEATALEKKIDELSDSIEAAADPLPIMTKIDVLNGYLTKLQDRIDGKAKTPAPARA